MGQIILDVVTAILILWLLYIWGRLIWVIFAVSDEIKRKDKK